MEKDHIVLTWRNYDTFWYLFNKLKTNTCVKIPSKFPVILYVLYPLSTISRDSAFDQALQENESKDEGTARYMINRYLLLNQLDLPPVVQRILIEISGNDSSLTIKHVADNKELSEIISGIYIHVRLIAWGFRYNSSFYWLFISEIDTPDLQNVYLTFVEIG